MKALMRITSCVYAMRMTQKVLGGRAKVNVPQRKTRSESGRESKLDVLICNICKKGGSYLRKSGKIINIYVLILGKFEKNMKI